MKEKISVVLLLIVILVSNLGMGTMIGSSVAKTGEKNAINSDSVGKMSAAALQDEATGKNQASNSNSSWQDAFEKKPAASADKWNFNNTNDWSNFTYADGNKTRLIVGVSGEYASDSAELARIMAEHEARVVNTFSIAGQVRAVVVELPLASVTAFVGEVHVMGVASYVEPNMRVQAQFVPNDQYWSLQWGPQQIGADWAWNTTVGSHSVLVAVVDTGIDYTHPDLAVNYAPLGYDWVNMDADPVDDNGHGTHCAGIIAAVLNNSIGVSGLAQVRVMTEKVLDNYGSGYWDWVANGIVHAADQGANIISMSFGGYGDSELVHEAIKYAYDKGVLLVAAAANDNTNMKSYPAAYDEVVSVAATDQYDNKAWFSNWGDWIELSAPGVDIYSTLPTYHVTLNDPPYSRAQNYDYLSGTSMACPHVSGVAALAWSLYSNRTRDWLRLWLRYTSDDLGDPGFDQYYGYGRVDARKAIQQTPPAHDLIAYEWGTPPYIEPGASGIINATILNFGENYETDVTVQLLANDSVVSSTTIDSLAGGDLRTVSLLWNPTVRGLYNVTLYVVPVLGEATVENNVLWKYVYVGVPVKAVVLHSYGNVLGDIITNWQVLSNEWYLFGGTMLYIDYMTLNKDNISYDDINATRADVLIISCASDPYAGWEFTDSEIEAIERYVYEGHGLVATAGTFYDQVPNNNKLAPLFGMNDTSKFSTTGTDLLHLLNTTHPLFMNVPNPLVFPQVETALPYDGRWDSNELVDGKYLALGHYQESAIVTCKGLVYISPWLEVIPPYYHHHLQLLYNAITWSRYQKPQHELVAALSAPEHVQPGESTPVSATVTNMGLSNESSVVLQLFIDGVMVDSAVIPKLIEDQSYTLSYSWKPTIIGTHNVTAYALPAPGEDFIANNVAGKIVRVSFTPKILVVDTPWPEDTGALDRIGYNYTLVSATQFATVDLFEYNVLFVGWEPTELVVDALQARASDIAEWVAAGNGLVALSEFEEPGRWGWLPLVVSSSGPVYGDNVHILNQTHPVMRDLTDAELSHWGNSYHGYFFSYDARWQALAEGVEVGSPITLAADYGNGRIVITQQDPDYHAYYNNERGAEKLLVNMIEWANLYFEHDLAVSLDAPKLLRSGASVLLNATVQNRGLNDETNVELQLLIDGKVVNSTSISELLMGVYCTLSYLWTPTVNGVYNVTAYSAPVENETVLRNNKATKLVTVTQPLISPLEGQYSNYALDMVDPTTGLEIGSGFWNFTYQSYISCCQMNVTVWMNEQSVYGYNYTQTGWLVVNVFTRMVEQDSGIYWSGMWFPGWIETNVTVGSTINLLSGNATVAGNEVIYVGGRPLDCWEIEFESYGYTYSFWYDKASGLWMDMTVRSPYEVANLTLEDTNVPLGFGFEHDVTLTVHVASMLPLNEGTIINATVYNTGSSNEASVALELLIDNTVVDQLTIDELLVAGYRSLIHSWVPTQTGAHNVTAYVQPVYGEGYTANNIATKSATVFFYSRVYISQRWVGGGVPMGWHDIYASWRYDLPFDFPFYGIPRRTIYISTNGLITFTSPDPSPGNGIAGLAQKLAIAPAWGFWVTYDPCDIYVWQNSTQVGIRWYALDYGKSVVVNFEAILNVDGVIQFDYGSSGGTVSVTAGISNGIGHIIAEDLTDLDQIRTTVFVPFYPSDVAITSVAASSYRVMTGSPVNVTVVAENHGMVDESFGVTAYASPSNSSRIYFDPSYCTFDAANVSVGYRFNVTVMVRNVEDLAAWQVRMFYDDNIINVTRWFEPASDPEYVFYSRTTFLVPPPPNCLYEHWGSRNGSAMVYGALQPFPPDQPSFSGSGKLCIFEFEVLAVPPRNQSYSCDLDIDNTDTLHFDSQAMWWGFDVYDNGRYWLGFGPSPPPPPTAAYVIGSINVVDLAPGSTISLTFPWNTTSVSPHGYRIWAEADAVPGEIDTDNNVYYDGTIKILKAPVASFTYSLAGEMITFDASSSTPGGGYITSYTWDFGDGNITATANPGVTHVYSSHGDYNVTLTVVDSEGLASSTWKLVQVWHHDVAVVAVYPYSSWVYASRSISINVTIANVGDFTENVTVVLYYNATASNKIDTRIVVLAPNETKTSTFTWNTGGVQPCRNYTMTAVATVPSDITPADNILSDGNIEVRILGDLNGDGKVDGKDLTMTAKVFGSYGPDYMYSGSSPGPTWNPDADINRDNVIDGKDLTVIARNFGKSYPS